MFKRIVKYTLLILMLGAAVLFRDIITGADKTELTSEAIASEGSHDRTAPVKEKKIKHWVAPMDPTFVQDKPGKSPMGMDLVPVYEDDDDGSAEGMIRIDPVTVQNIGVRTTKAKKGSVSREIRTAGQITYNEELVEHIHSKVSGWVENLYVDTTGEEVRAGEELLAFYSPDLVATQEEYLQAIRYRDKASRSKFPEIADGAESLVEASRKRLSYMDISDEQISALEKRGEVSKEMQIFSPKTGVVIRKNVIQGMKIDPMMELYTIADIRRVWVIASIYEYELPFIKTGQVALMTLPYEPGVQYTGKVTFIYPYLSNKTRTVQVRMEFDNPRLKLKPDMYADVQIKTGSGSSSVIVPSEALLRTGQRNVVITAIGEGKFLPKDVTPGIEGDGYVEILSGIEAGEEVVVSGQFLIDSESNLREAVNKMLAAREKSKEAEAENKGTEMQNADTINISQKLAIMMDELLDAYLEMHEVLVAESASDVAAQAGPLSSQIAKITAADTEGRLKEFTGQIEESQAGLSSADLAQARNSFKLFSRAMFEYLKQSGNVDPASKGIKAYLCPMENEWWIQKEGDLKNPYLGKEMWICAVEEKI